MSTSESLTLLYVEDEDFIRKNDTKTPIIITTAHTDTAYLPEAIELQLVKYLVKPIDEKRLHEALQLCFDKLRENSSNIISLAGGFVYDTFHQTLFHHQTQKQWHRTLHRKNNYRTGTAGKTDRNQHKRRRTVLDTILDISVM